MEEDRNVFGRIKGSGKSLLMGCKSLILIGYGSERGAITSNGAIETCYVGLKFVNRCVQMTNKRVN